MDISEESLALHYKLRGKLEVVSRYPIQTQKDLSLAYTCLLYTSPSPRD